MVLFLEYCELGPSLVERNLIDPYKSSAAARRNARDAGLTLSVLDRIPGIVRRKQET